MIEREEAGKLSQAVARKFTLKETFPLWGGGVLNKVENQNMGLITQPSVSCNWKYILQKVFDTGVRLSFLNQTSQVKVINT